MMAGLFGWVSIGLMFYYDLKLALIALLLTIFRALLIISVSAIRLYHESKYFNLQGKTSGFVLQLISGIGKLRVAAATVRSLAVWSSQFVDQRQHFIASQQAANALGVFEATFPLIATMIIFAVATSDKSELLLNIGGFLAFFSRVRPVHGLGRRMGIGSERSADRHPSSDAPSAVDFRCAPKYPKIASPRVELSGAVEFSRLTFRYVSQRPAGARQRFVQDLPGEYVAIVGPSGSGKSSLISAVAGL